MWAKPTLRAKSSVSLKFSSVSPGKPAIRSVVTVRPGIAVARGRDQRLEVRDPVAPRHPPQDCVAARLGRQVQVRHQPALAVRPQIEEAGRQIERLQRRQPQPWDARLRQQRAHQCAQIRAEVAPVASQMHAGQHGFLVALSVQCVYLGHELGDRSAALVPARHGHDAKGAVIAAAVLGFDEGAGPQCVLREACCVKRIIV